MLTVEEIHSYYGESHALQGVSLEVAQGEVVCVLGRNGAGKSTTLKSIVSMVPPSRGRVIFDGREIQRLPTYRVARLGIALVPEDRRIFAGLTVKENLEVAERQAPAGGEKRWSIERILDQYPMLAELRNQDGATLSGGEQQILAVVRALMTEPRLLLMDEPTEGLAPVIVRQIGELLEELSKTTTILFSEQNVTFALRHAQRTYILEKGRVAWSGTSRDIREDPAIQERYLSVA